MMMIRMVDMKQEMSWEEQNDREEQVGRKRKSNVIQMHKSWHY